MKRIGILSSYNRELGTTGDGLGAKLYLRKSFLIYKEERELTIIGNLFITDDVVLPSPFQFIIYEVIYMSIFMQGVEGEP